MKPALCISCKHAVKVYPETINGEPILHMCSTCLTWHEKANGRKGSKSRSYIAGWRCFCRFCGKLIDDDVSRICKSCKIIFEATPGKNSYEKWRYLERSKSSDYNESDNLYFKYAHEIAKRNNKSLDIFHKCNHIYSPKMQLHHMDYKKPLEVMDLCQHCHLGFHGRLKSEHREQWIMQMSNL